MSVQLITKFLKASPISILNLATNLGRNGGADCMRLSNVSKTTGTKDVFAFILRDELVLLMIDWYKTPWREFIDKDTAIRQPISEFETWNHRVSPASRLKKFFEEYRMAMAASGVELKKTYLVLVTNATIANYHDMVYSWDEDNMKVFQGVKADSRPHINCSLSFHTYTIDQYRAVKRWYDEHPEMAKGNGDEEDGADSYYEMKFAPGEDAEYTFDFYESMYADPGETDRIAHVGNDNGDDDICFEEEEYDDDFEIPELSDSTGSKYRRTVPVEILPPISYPQDELDRMVGCDNVKRQINDLLTLTRYNWKMTRRFPNWTWHKVSLHGVFTGHPGTGKTTLCKIYGALLRRAGMLTKGHVVVCSRGTFVGTSWGDEEEAVNQVLELADGGVLMIDEAYLLNSPHPNDPGKRVLPLFMDKLADEKHRNIAVILCGYKEPMDNLLSQNAGLDSRFPNRFDFKDFSIDELMEITHRRLKVYGYHFTRAGLQKYRAVLTQAYADRDPHTWGNARFVANLLENIYLLHAKRCMKSKTSSGYRHPFSITPSDIQPIHVAKERRGIGF